MLERTATSSAFLEPGWQEEENNRILRFGLPVLMVVPEERRQPAFRTGRRSLPAVEPGCDAFQIAGRGR
jgi:hypothetical protein